MHISGEDRYVVGADSRLHEFNEHLIPPVKMAPATHREAVIGNPDRPHWVYNSLSGFDLSHSTHPTVTIPTTTEPITLGAPTTALVVIDMQNFFLSPALGRPRESNGQSALRQLVDHAIPAARKAGIRVIWLNWGLTDEDISNMPASIIRTFGFESVEKDASGKTLDVENVGTDAEAPRTNGKTIVSGGKSPKIYRGLGRPMGPVTLESGETVDAGRQLFRGAWNSDLYAPLAALYAEGQTRSPPDVWVHKNRMSGLWGAGTPCTEFLAKHGIQTLLFTGVNTDQCVAGSLQDAFSKGFDCVLLKDGCGTSSPVYAQECVEYNCARSWGFVTTCKDFADAVDKM